MIDFSLEPYEWQKEMNTIMQNVNLNKISIIDNVTMVFEFLNSYDGGYYKKIICHSVWKLSTDICNYAGDGFPFFICDIKVIDLEDSDVKPAFANYGFGFTIPESNDYILLCMESGDISINLICGKVEILD